MNSARKITVLSAAAFCVLLTFVIDLFVGDISVSLEDFFNSPVILHLRLPRAITALAAGGALATAGAQMQSIFRNPLADPHIMGVSSGSALGAAIVIIDSVVDARRMGKQHAQGDGRVRRFGMVQGKGQVFVYVCIQIDPPLFFQLHSA